MNIQRIIIGLIAVALFSTSLLAATAKLGEVATPMNAVQTFEKKQCVRCHLIDVSWDAYGPDLARTSLSGNFSDIVGRMWNKAPVMLTKMNELNVGFPNLQSDDLIRVASFVGVYQNMLSDYTKGADVEHGVTLFHRNKCANCHKSKRMRGAFSSPLLAIEALWKHRWSVSRKGKSSQVAWKRLKKDDVKDFLAFLTDSKAQDGAEASALYLAPGDASLGKLSFAKLNCASCHNSDGTVKAKAGGAGKKRSNERLEVENILAAFWNHSPQVWKVTEKSSKKPAFDAQALADLTAYWYAQRFEQRQDDLALGESLFEQKSCVSCHEIGSEDFTFPGNRDELLAKMWSSIPDMVEACEDQEIDWPKMGTGEISAITEYLLQTKR